MNDSATQYKKYEIQMQRAELFKLISEIYSIKIAIYPGSYIHISPSFYIPEVVYIDNDSNAKKFFSDNSFRKLIEKEKEYTEETVLRFHPQSYMKKLTEKEDYFDLLISQYSGPVSFYCKKYLKTKGFLLVNNSHGDAGIADLDPDFELIAVINYRNDKFYHSTKNLESYFIPKKKDITVTIEKLLETSKGIGYTKTASHYLFQKRE